jgi:hypothetical protein
VKHSLIIFALFLSGQISYGNVQTGKTMSKTNSHHWAFEENKGQVLGRDSAQVQFFYKQSPLTIFLRNTGLTYQFTQVHRSKENGDKSFDDHSLETDIKELPLNKIETYRMDMELVGANAQTEVIKEQASEDYIRYYNNNALDVRSYQKIIYKNIYKGIDWIVYAQPKGQTCLPTRQESNTEINFELSTLDFQLIKYDFIVHPGADPSQIKMRIKWAEDLKLDEQGNLVMRNSLGEVKEDAPISFQDQSLVHSKFCLMDSILRFELGEYDKSKTLIIDPSLAWFTYYGGEPETVSRANCIDKNGDVYMAGETESATMIADGGHQLTYNKSVDAFLAKFSSDGKRIWASYYGGDGGDRGYGCAVDDHNNVYLTGFTSTSNKIAINGYKNYLGSGYRINAFLVKFNSQGVRQWGTYFGYRWARANAIAIRGNQIYIAGVTSFLTNPSSQKDTSLAIGGHQMIHGGGIYDGFIAKFDTLGQFYWSSYYGGSGDDQLDKIVIDNQEDVYYVGRTSSTNQISHLGFQNALNKGFSYTNTDGLIVKFNSSGSRLWASYLGSPYKNDNLTGCKIDKDNNLILLGSTADTSFMTQGFMHDSTVGFVAKLQPNGGKLWARAFGSIIRGCAIDEDKNIYVSGTIFTSTPNLFLNGFKTYVSSGDIIVSKLSTLGVVDWSTYYGGTGNEGGFDLSISKNNDIYVCGVSGPTTGVSGIYSDSLGYKGHQNSRMNAFWNGFLMKICQDPQLPEIAILSNTGTDICAGKEVIFSTQTKNAGLTPNYIWKKNGQNVGNNQPTFTTNQINDKDSIECWMVSSAACISQDTVKSNKLAFNVKKPDTTNAFDTVCDGTVYRFGSQNLTSAGTYQARLQDVNGCDSLVYLSLWFRPRSLYSYSFTTTCAQPSYFFKGQTRTVSGVYRDTLKAQNGCDSLIILNLTVKSPTSFRDSFQLCEGDSLKFGGNYIKSAGIYQRVIPNAAGCDSTITMYVTILKPVKKDSMVQTCPPYNYKGRNYEVSTKIFDTIYNYQGCDSIYLTIDAQIKDKPLRRADIRYEACDSMRIGGKLYRSSFQYIDTIRTKDALKCDSIYQPYYYTIYETPSARFYPRTKDTMLRGQTLKFRANTAEHYLWSTGYKESILEFKLTEDVQIYLIAWNHELCKDTTYLDLWAFDPIILDFPTGFNPMSSYPENRYFKPNYTGKLDAMQFDIFNRLGEKVYSSYNVHDLGWDGSYKNQLAPNGVYTYIFEYSSFRYRYIKTGEVLLVR